MIKAITGMMVSLLFNIIGFHVESLAVIIISTFAFLVCEIIALFTYEDLRDRLSKVESKLKCIEENEYEN